MSARVLMDEERLIDWEKKREKEARQREKGRDAERPIKSKRWKREMR